jgi:AraC-like DNA-binding protein
LVRLGIFHDEGMLVTEACRIPIAAESLVVWRTTTPPTAYGHAHRRWSQSWIMCAGTIIDALLAETALPVLTPIPLPGPATAARSLLGLYQELTTHRHPDPGILASLLRLLLLEARRCHLGADTSADPEGLLWVRRRLDEHPDRAVSLESLARERGWSTRHLSRRFTAVWGTTPAVYRTRVRMDHACALLDQPQASLAEIARAVGYADAFAFSKAFKRHTGVSPLRYRSDSRLSPPK